jgi:peptide/nickel transport system substrate-binding protein
MNRRFDCRLVSIFLFFFILLTTSVVLPEAGDTVRIGWPGFSTVNIIEDKGLEWVFTDLMHEGILAQDPRTGKFVERLAKSIRLISKGRDIRVSMRRGARFHTGDPVTAHDVRFTWKQLLDPRNRYVYSSIAAEVKDIEIIDDYNYIVRMYEPYASWKQLMIGGVCSKRYYERVGRERFRSHPVGSGPFRFMSWEPGKEVLLEAVENHHNIRVGFKRLKFVLVMDAVTQMAMLETGGLDMIWGILPHHLKRLRQKKHIRIKRSDMAPSLIGLTFKPDNYPVMDLNLSNAVNYAINRKEIIDRVYLGEGYPLYMYASKAELGYDPRFKIPFDPARARRLVKRSQYKPGTPLTLTYVAAGNSALLAQVVQNYLRNIGLTVELQQLEGGIYGTYIRTRDRRLGHMYLYAWAPGIDPSTRLFTTIMSTSPYNSNPHRPHWRLIDSLVKKQAHETNEKKRIAILRRIHRLLGEGPGGAVLFGLNMIYAIDNHIDYTWVPRAAIPLGLHTISIVR